QPRSGGGAPLSVDAPPLRRLRRGPALADLPRIHVEPGPRLPGAVHRAVLPPVAAGVHRGSAAAEPAALRALRFPVPFLDLRPRAGHAVLPDGVVSRHYPRPPLDPGSCLPSALSS